MALGAKRRAFVEHYLACWNASEAARQAGYAHADRQGHRLLKNVEVAKMIQDRLAELKLTADEVLKRLADQARGSMTDFLSIEEEVVDEEDDGEEPSPAKKSTRTHWSIDLAKAAAAGKLHLIKSIERTRYGIRLDLYDAQAALRLLGQAHGLFVDKHEHSGPQGGPIEIIEVVADEPAADEDSDS